MILNIFFSPDEIREFFENNGFEVRQEETGRWEKQSHGSDKYTTWMEEHVVIDGAMVRASLLFDRIAENRIKHMITPASNEARKEIETQFNHILKGN